MPERKMFLTCSISSNTIFYDYDINIVYLRITTTILRPYFNFYSNNDLWTTTTVNKEPLFWGVKRVVIFHWFDCTYLSVLHFSHGWKKITSIKKNQNQKKYCKKSRVFNSLPVLRMPLVLSTDCLGYRVSTMSITSAWRRLPAPSAASSSTSRGWFTIDVWVRPLSSRPLPP